MSKQFHNINRLMGSAFEMERQERARQARAKKREQSAIAESVNRLRQDFDSVDERRDNFSEYVRDAVDNFHYNEALAMKDRFDKKYHNDIREETQIVLDGNDNSE